MCIVYKIYAIIKKIRFMTICHIPLKSTEIQIFLIVQLYHLFCSTIFQIAIMDYYITDKMSYLKCFNKFGLYFANKNMGFICSHKTSYRVEEISY